MTLIVALGWIAATATPAMVSPELPLGELEVGVPVSGTVVEGQIDRWEVELEAGDGATLELIGDRDELAISPVNPNGVGQGYMSSGEGPERTVFYWDTDISGRWTVEVSLDPFGTGSVSATTYTIEYLGGSAPVFGDIPDAAAPTGGTFEDSPFDETFDESPSSGGRSLGDFVLGVLTLLAPIAAFLLVRELTVRIVRRFMNRRSPRSEQIAEAADPSTAATLPVETLPLAAREAPQPAGSLAILDVGWGGGVLLSGESERRFARTEDQLRGVLIAHVASAIAFVALLLLAALAHGVDARLVAVVALVALVLLLVVAWWFRRFGVPIGWISAWLVAVLLVVSVIGAATWGPLMALPGIAFSMGVWLAYRARGEASAAVGKQDLVVLRVFDSDASAATTFGTLASHWRHLGPVVTIADPSFVRYEYSPFNRTNRFRMMMYLIVVVAVGAILRTDSIQRDVMDVVGLDRRSKSEQDRAIMLVTFILVVPIAAVPVLATVWIQFCQRRDELVRRIDRRLGSVVAWHGAYPTKALYCYDDLWRTAVDRMLLGGEVVLMDLRGFQPDNIGCAYEICQVIDRVPIHRVVLVIDDSTDRRTVLELFAEGWVAMASDSPNRGLARAELKVFTAHWVVTRSDGWWRWLRSLSSRQRVWASDAEKITALMTAAPDPDGIVEPRSIWLEVSPPPSEHCREAEPATNVLVSGQQDRLERVTGIEPA